MDGSTSHREQHGKACFFPPFKAGDSFQQDQLCLAEGWPSGREISRKAGRCGSHREGTGALSQVQQVQGVPWMAGDISKGSSSQEAAPRKRSRCSLIRGAGIQIVGASGSQSGDNGATQ